MTTTTKAHKRAVVHPRYDEIDEASAESFPTSDPPAWTLGTQRTRADYVLPGTPDVAQLLAYEHEVIKEVVVYAINKLVLMIENGKQIDKTVLTHIDEFLHQFVGQCYHEKEAALFPLLRQSKEGLSDYLLNDLEQENQAGKQLLAEIDSIMKKYLKNAENLAIKKKLLFLIKEARHLYLNHLEKEEEYIFPNLSEFISKEKRKDLVGQFAEIDKHTQRSHQDLIKLAKTINEELG